MCYVFFKLMANPWSSFYLASQQQPAFIVSSTYRDALSLKQSSLGLPEITSPWIFFFFSGPLSTDPSASHLSGDLAQAVASNGRYIWMTLKLSLAELSSELQTNIING